ncbi:amidohydrolase [Brevibacterium litoralis]|uniref:amidohydrolase n=1 Tax=Brevibacterium litoralis TaxID=3138935 RepID=UPI0032EB34C5
MPHAASSPPVTFTNARVFTGEGFSEPLDVHVSHGRIAAVTPAANTTPAARTSATTPAASAPTASEIVDLDGSYLMPGFVESHAHPTFYGLNLLNLDVRPSAVQSITEIQKVVQIAAQDTPEGEWVLGAGFDETYILEGRMPTRADLDEVAPDVPVYLERTCTHMGVVNSKALEVSGVDESTPDPEGGTLVKDAAGRLTGLVQEDAKKLIAKPAATDARMEKGFRLAQQDFTRWGVTTVNDCIVTPQIMRVYERFDARGEFAVRMRPWLYAVPFADYPGMLDAALGAGISSGFGNDMLRIQGVKYQLDGAMGPRTAAMCCPFEGTEETGILAHDFDLLVDTFGRAVRGGLRLAIHAIGDGAMDQALRALEATGELDWIKANRIRIEHSSLPTTSQLDTMAEWNLIASSSIGFVYHLGDSFPSVLGADRIERLLPHRSYQERGIVAPGNSDLPVTDGNPWAGIYGAVTRTTKTGRVLDTVQNIDLAAALRAYTSDAAYATCEEDRAGTVEPGKFADLQVYAHNPFDLEPEAWLDLSPEQVWLAGKRLL